METKQVQQLKINVTNISSFLKQSNKTYIGLKRQNSTLLSNQIQRRKLEAKEKKIETKNIPKFGLGTVGNKVASTAGSIFDKILGFGSLILAGVLVNSLPKIIETVKGVVDSIVEFVTPIQSAFNIVKGFMTGSFEKSEYDADKKRVDDKLEGLSKKGGLIDQIAEQTGILEPLIKLLKPAIEAVRNVIGGKNKVLAMKGGKEGVLDKGTGTFTERQFTTSERQRFQTGGRAPSTAASDSGAAPSGVPSMGSQARGNYGPYTKAFLDTIAFAEGTYHQPNTGYNTHFAFDRTEDLSAHPALIKSGGGYRSDAFGRYQFMSPTWAGLGGAVNPHDGKPFKSGRDMSPANQDWGAVQLTLSRLRSAGYKVNNASDLERILKSEGLSKRFAAAMSGEWASFPNAVGVSAYGQPVKKLNSLQNFFGKIIKQPKITPVPNNKGDQAKALNTTVGEDGSTTIIVATQPIVTGEKGP